MAWHDYILRSEEACLLEARLSPVIVEHDEGMKSTANTDVKKKIIHVDVTQPEIKCALSYSYELKNLENAEKYEHLNKQAQSRAISKVQYIRSIIRLEAEAAYFRCLVVSQLGYFANDIAVNQNYMRIFDATHDLPKEQALDQLAQYIEENATVRREYPAKKYYADCYDTITNKRSWPSFYDEKRSTEILIPVEPSEPINQVDHKPK